MQAVRNVRARRARALAPSQPAQRTGTPAQLTPAQRRFDSVVGLEQFRKPGRTIVILADPTLRKQVRRWVACFLSGTVHVISSEAQPEWALEQHGATFHVHPEGRGFNWPLKLIGPIDVLIDLQLGSLADYRKRWENLFFHVKPNGWWVIDASVGDLQPFGRDAADWISTVLGADDAEAPAAADLTRELARSTARVSVSRDLLVVEKRHKHYVKLRDDETNRVLPSRERGVAVTELATMPAGQLHSRARAVSYESSVSVDGLHETMDYPALHLRHYQGELALISNSLVHTEYTILADSYRYHLAPNPFNPRTVNVTPTFARIPAHLRPTQTLSGNYYLLDSPFSGHFGHVMSELISRLWGWDEAKQAIPGLKAIYRMPGANERKATLEERLFRAYGIAEEDIVRIEDPVSLESLAAATPMWHNQTPHYVHPRIAETWQRLGDNLIDPAAPEYEKIFVSRQSSLKHRRCRNTETVEDLFRAHGFEIVYPELHDLSVQAGIFSKARVIAGFGGSAMFNMLFARNVSTVILLSHEAYTARNEHLYTSVLGADVHYFWSPPDLPHPTGGWSQDAFYSDWEFDFDRNGDALKKVLTSL